MPNTAESGITVVWMLLLAKLTAKEWPYVSFDIIFFYSAFTIEILQDIVGLLPQL